MALRQIEQTRQLNDLKKKLRKARSKQAGFLLREKEYKRREDELDAQLESAVDDAKDAIEASIDVLEEAVAQLEEDNAANDELIDTLEEQIDELEDQLNELEDRVGKVPRQKREGEGKVSKEYVRVRNRFGNDLPELVTREDVKGFLTRVRELQGQNRAVNATELLIPEMMLELLRDTMHRYSKLIGEVNLRTVKGKARQRIVGTIPEGVWTEMLASLNELDFGFNAFELDGYKVGGFIPIGNATLADSDINLASEILDMIGQAIGIALDKAILYGTGKKMPIGIATRLAQTKAPDYWDEKAPEWSDLHGNHLIKVNTATYGGDNAKFFADLMLFLSVPRQNFSNGSKFWAMNETTWNKIVSMTVTFNAAGALVCSENMSMPLVGGGVTLLDFIPDGDIIGGYGSLYLLVEREGSEFAVSEHVRFLDDQTVYKGTARYDGMPVFGEGFVMVNINNKAPVTTIPFKPDDANIVVPPIMLPPTGNHAGAVEAYIYSPTANATIYYTTDGSKPTEKSQKYTRPIEVKATATIKAITTKPGAEPSSVTEATYTIA